MRRNKAKQGKTGLNKAKTGHPGPLGENWRSIAQTVAKPR